MIALAERIERFEPALLQQYPHRLLPGMRNVSMTFQHLAS